MRVLLTGASGFVGGEILHALKSRGHEIVLATRKPLAGAEGLETRMLPDLGELNSAQAARLLEGVEAIIHSAGHAHAGPGSDPAIHASVNARATILLAEAAARAGAQFVFLSSIKAMGPADAQGFLREDVMREPDDAYGRSKRDAEAAIRASLPENHVILRPALVVGPGVKGNLAALRRLASLRVPLPFAGIEARRSMISLSDLADVAARALLESEWRGRSLIVADPVPVSLPEIVTAMRAGMSRGPGLFYVPESLLAAALSLMGRADWAAPLFSPLIAEPAFLTGRGWQPSKPVFSALSELAAR